ncbi:MAG: YceI family protein [Cyclobacteriaceae bacterium]
MKTLKTFSYLLTVIFILAIVVQCSDDPAPVQLSSISGQVTYPDAGGAQIAAPGAIVTLFSTTPVVNMETTTDASGNFTFPQLVAATYTISAYYDTDNTNSSGRLSNLRFTGAPTDVVLGAESATQNLALTSTGQTGISSVDINYSWNGSTYVQTGSWTYDATHSPLSFEFPYRDGAAEFVGAFSQLNKIVVDFDPADLGSSTIEAIVDLTSVNTRSRGGRDPESQDDSFNPTSVYDVAGCIMGTFGVTADGAFPTTYTSADRFAKFTSTGITAYGDGYLAKGNLEFHGFTNAIELWFKMTPNYVEPSNNRTYATFEGRFYMNAKEDYGISSSSVNDAQVRMQISIVAYQAP